MPDRLASLGPPWGFPGASLGLLSFLFPPPWGLPGPPWAWLDPCSRLAGASLGFPGPG
jgi:hypothetical protein